MLEYIHRIKYCPSITKFTCQLSTHATNYNFWNFVSSLLFLFYFFLHPFTFIVSLFHLWFCVLLLVIYYLYCVGEFLSFKFLLNKQLKSSIIFPSHQCGLYAWFHRSLLLLNILMIMMNNQNSILTIYYNFFLYI